MNIAHVGLQNNHDFFLLLLKVGLYRKAAINWIFRIGFGVRKNMEIDYKKADISFLPQQLNILKDIGK
jgi:hypothetical protein